MFTGVHVLQPRFLDRVPSTGQQCIVRTAYTALVPQRRERVGRVHLAPGRDRRGAGVQHRLERLQLRPRGGRVAIGVNISWSAR